MAFDKMDEECGVFAITGNEDVVKSALLALHALQHRGQEAFGISLLENNRCHTYRAQGYVNSAFNIEMFSEAVRKVSTVAIGHVRYATSGDKNGIQPFVTQSRFGDIALAHNGNLVNTALLRNRLTSCGIALDTSIDTELIIRLIASSDKPTFAECLYDALGQIKGAYALTITCEGKIYGVRDPAGIRQIVMGITKSGAYVLASETCALDSVGATYVRDIKQGEIVIIDAEQRIESAFPLKLEKPSSCIFEYVYFSRPDSILEKGSVYDIRKRIGRELAIESPPPIGADVVVPVPDSGVPAAIGYAVQCGLNFEFGIIRNHYIGRTFIKPTDQERNSSVKLKHSPNQSVLRDKIVVLIDDSIVRGTTLKNLISVLKAAGTREVHLRISSPPTKHSCFYGVDTPNTSKLMASNHSTEEMAVILGADSLAFISLNGLYRAVCNENRDNTLPQFCDACFSGEYPIGVSDEQ